MKIKLLAFSSIDECNEIFHYLDQTLFASVPDFLFTKGVTPKIPTAREKNLWYPGYYMQGKHSDSLSGSLMLFYDCN